MQKIITLLLLAVSFNLFSQVQELTDANVKSKLNINDGKIVVVDFYATWCGPCKIIAPIMEEVSKEYSKQVSIYKLNVDKHIFDDQVGIRAMPTLYFYKNGVLLEQVVGAVSKEKILQVLKKHGLKVAS